MEEKGKDDAIGNITQWHNKHREEMWDMKHWRAWGSWYSWGSPIGLGLFFVEIGLFLWVLRLAGIIH